MRIDLAAERRQAGFIETKLLLFQSLLVEVAVPDLDGQRHAEQSGGVDGHQQPGPRRSSLLAGRRPLGSGSAEARVCRSTSASTITPTQAMLKPARRRSPRRSRRTEARVGVRRELPDDFLIRSEIAQQPAHHAGGGEQQHGQGLALKHGGDGNQHAGQQAGDVAAEHPHHQASFHSQVDGLIRVGLATRTATPAP